ncbi:MAG: hypothetical protein ACRCYR_03700 [Phycicoccus sp.]
MDPTLIGVAFTGIAAILTAAAGLIRAMRATGGAVRRRNRHLERWREQAEVVIRLLVRTGRDHGVPEPPEVGEARTRLEAIGEELDSHDDKDS